MPLKFKDVPMGEKKKKIKEKKWGSYHNMVNFS